MALPTSNSTTYRNALLHGIELFKALVAEADAINSIPDGASHAQEIARINAAARPVQKAARKLAGIRADGEVLVSELADMAARLAA